MFYLFGRLLNNGEKISIFLSAAESANIVISHVTFMAQKYCFRTKCAWSKNRVEYRWSWIRLPWFLMFFIHSWSLINKSALFFPLCLLNELTVIPVEAAVINSLFSLFISLTLSLISTLLLCHFGPTLFFAPDNGLFWTKMKSDIPISGHKLFIYFVICLEIDPVKLK